MKKDKLFKIFSQFEIRKSSAGIITGGTSGATTDPDGCTTVWTDNSSGNTTHDHDYNPQY